MGLEFLENVGGGSVDVLARIDKIFSRKVLGGAFVTYSATMILDILLRIATDDILMRLVLWVIVFFLTIVLFVLWQRVEEAIDDLGD